MHDKPQKPYLVPMPETAELADLIAGASGRRAEGFKRKFEESADQVSDMAIRLAELIAREEYQKEMHRADLVALGLVCFLIGLCGGYMLGIYL